MLIILENAAQIVRFIGHVKPSGTEANGMKMTSAALPAIIIQNAPNPANPKRNKNNYSLKLFPLRSLALLILLNL